MSDDFGARMKEYESYETGRTFMPGLPVYARLDGRGFSKFTKGMLRPYDLRMSKLMIEVTKYLVKETNAKLGYVQSDEISLIYNSDDFKSEIFFNRRITKLTSVLAGMASAYFAIHLPQHFSDDWERLQSRVPHFDNRVLQMPSKTEAANMILWRAMDARKNSVSMAAQSKFSHKSLHGMNSVKMQERLFQEAGIDFNDYPDFFKQGTFIKRVPVQMEKQLPEGVVDKHPEITSVTRHVLWEMVMPPFNKVINRTDVIFNGDEPIIEEEK